MFESIALIIVFSIIFFGIIAFGGRLVRGTPAGFDETIERMNRHILPDSILPDMDVIDPKQRVPSVNYLVLYDLAQRAERGLDPHANLVETYRLAEISWARGDFKMPS